MESLPEDSQEASTRVSETSDPDGTRSEQPTLLDTPDGEVAVRADRHDEVAADLADAEAQALEVIELADGATAYLLAGGRLVWLADDTLLEVDGPTEVDGDTLIDLADRVEVLP